MNHLIEIDPLLFRPGDSMSREEFLDCWKQMPDLEFAELIDGMVYMPPPLWYECARFNLHANAWIGYYADHTLVCSASVNATCLMLDSAPQPDLVLRLISEFGGRTTRSRRVIDGAPELIIEVCHASRSYDLGPKLSLYERAGVDEYIAIMVEDKRIEWRVLQAGSYRLLEPDSDGIYRSHIFPGLWLDQAAYWREDPKQWIAVSEQGLKSHEHSAFLARFNV